MKVRHRASQVKVAVAVGVLTLVVTGCGPNWKPASQQSAAPPAPQVTSSGSTSPSSIPAPSTSPISVASPTSRLSTVTVVTSGSAMAAVMALAVKGRAPKTGYSRAQFGAAWVDVDRNGCDTRNDMLIKDLTSKVMSGTCKVMAGTLTDPYTATSIRFIRGGVSEVDIDHVVALSDAWQTGAAQWPYAKRVALANDPLNLQPTSASANRQKGDSDAASWLPASAAYRCSYVARQVAVKRKYGAWVTAAEKTAMVAVLTRCPGQALPAPGPQPTTASNTGGKAPTTSAPATPKPKPTKTSTGGGLDPQFGTCKAAKAAGYGPYVQGKDPEYNWYRDADHDGVDCE